MTTTLLPFRKPPSGPRVSDLKFGSVNAESTADVELFRKALSPNRSVAYSLFSVITRTTDFALATLGIGGFVAASRDGNAAPTFSAGVPAVVPADPNGLGVGFAFTIDGNDVVITGTNASGDPLAWIGQISEIQFAPGS